MKNLDNVPSTRIENREKITLQIEGGSIEIKKSYFEYPEHIQKETQIKGYTKYKLALTDVENFLDGSKHKELFNTYDSEVKKKKADLERKYQGRDGWQNKEFVNELNQNRTEWERGYEKLDPKMEMLRILSGGNFPDKTYNHVMQGDSTYGEGQREELYNNKFILTKIDNIKKSDTVLGYRFGKSVQVMVNKEGKVLLTGDFSTSSTADHVRYTPWEGKKSDGDGIMVDETNFSESKEISKEEFSKLIENNLIISTMGGIYSGYGRLWDKRFVKPVFGFDPNDEPFKDYLAKVKNIYEKLPDHVISNKGEVSLEHLLSDVDSKNKGAVNDKSLHYGEVMIPVMTGETGLPKFCWGYAKYAVIPTEKNFNFLVIDHVQPSSSN
jgi:hypothetical protein